MNLVGCETQLAAALLTLAGRAAEHEREVPFALAVEALDDHTSFNPCVAAALPGYLEERPLPAPGTVSRREPLFASTRGATR